MDASSSEAGAPLLSIVASVAFWIRRLELQAAGVIVIMKYADGEEDPDGKRGSGFCGTC